MAPVFDDLQVTDVPSLSYSFGYGLVLFEEIIGENSWHDYAEK